MVAWNTIPGYWRLIEDMEMRSAQLAAPTVETREQAIACEIRRAGVDLQLVEDIERTVRMASRTLGLDPEPRLRWLPSETRAIRGIVFGDALSEIWVKVQDVAATRDTALHELKHVHQLRGDHYRTLGLLTYEQRQDDADQFARTWPMFDQPVPVAAHAQRSAPAMTPASSTLGRQIWEEKYGPSYQAYQEYVADRQQRVRRR